MKTVLVSASFFWGVLALALSLVSAQKYGGIFIATVIADAIALVCLFALNYRTRQPWWLNVVLGVLVIYTLMDVFLRFIGFGNFFGVIGSLIA